MPENIAKFINRILWKEFKALFPLKEIKNMKRMKVEDGIETYWLCFHSQAYMANVFGGKVLSVCTFPC